MLNIVLPLIYVKGVKLCRDFGENTPRRREIKSVAITASERNSLKFMRLGGALSEFFIILILSSKIIFNREYEVAMQMLTDQLDCVIISLKSILNQLKFAHGLEYHIWFGS